MRKIIVIIFVIAVLLGASLAMAYDSFYPEATPELETGSSWFQPMFKRNDTMCRVVFRVWYPYPAKQIWNVLTDTNLWKDIHSDYTDSRSLDKNQFDRVAQKKPTSVKTFYEMVGEEIFPSDYNRQAGGVWTSYVFQRFNLPWPLKDRWVVMKVKNDESQAAEGRYRYEYKMVAGNFKELKGYWELLPVPGKPDLTEFRGDYKTDPGIQVPQFLAKSLYRSSLKSTTDENLAVMAKGNRK